MSEDQRWIAGGGGPARPYAVRFPVLGMLCLLMAHESMPPLCATDMYIFVLTRSWYSINSMYSAHLSLPCFLAIIQGLVPASLYVTALCSDLLMAHCDPCRRHSSSRCRMEPQGATHRRLTRPLHLPRWAMALLRAILPLRATQPPSSPRATLLSTEQNASLMRNDPKQERVCSNECTGHKAMCCWYLNVCTSKWRICRHH